jgi:hypothetical protein
MVHDKGPKIKKVEANLRPEEKEIIPNFHNTSIFHANEEVKSLWLQKSEQVLYRKGQRHLIYVSALINPETGHLILSDDTGAVVQDSTKIIYPGSGGNSWWDCE